MFVGKMAAIFTDTSTQSNTPLSCCSVDNVLTKVTRLFHQKMLQVVDVVDPGVVHASLEHSPDLIVDWIEIWGIGRPHQWLSLIHI